MPGILYIKAMKLGINENNFAITENPTVHFCKFCN